MTFGLFLLAVAAPDLLAGTILPCVVFECDFQKHFDAMVFWAATFLKLLRHLSFDAYASCAGFQNDFPKGIEPCSRILFVEELLAGFFDAVVGFTCITPPIFSA